jgi:NAD dependent epimerase/dehydratase family enzyme
LVKLAKEWEAAARAPGVPVALPRIGIVLSRSGGSLPVLIRAAKSWIGAGRLGSGDQFISWIHLDDLVGLILRALDDCWEGTFNAVSPHPLRQGEFMRTLCRLLGRPGGPPAPAPLVRLASTISGVPLHLALEGQRVYPDRALQAGFVFRFPELMSALKAEILGK